MERFIIPFVGAVVIFIVLGKLIHVRFIKYAALFFLALSVMLFIYYFYQMNYYNEMCNPDDGCMNEFGLFIILPISTLLISIVMFISLIFQKKPQKDEFS